MIAHSGILGRPPFCISDADISPIIKSPTVELGGFTDMSFSSMTHQALICWRKLTHAPTDSEGQPIKLRQGWSTRSCIVKDWEQKLRERYLQYCDASQPFQLFTKYVGEGMIVTMQLLERRPLHGFLSSGPPPADGYDLLKVATDVLEASLLKQTDQSLTPWSWFSWAKWYALAVALSELCGHTQGLQVEKAWIAVEASFSKIMDLVVDDGLCKSLEKLMAKARSVRDSGQTSLPSLTPAIEKLPELSLEGSTATSPGDYRSSYPDDGSRSEQAHSYGNFKYDKGAPGIPPRPTQQLLTTEVNDLMQTDWIQEPDAMSWANWEQFMTDVSEFDAPQTLDTVFWGQSS